MLYIGYGRVSDEEAQLTPVRYRGGWANALGVKTAINHTKVKQWWCRASGGPEFPAVVAVLLHGSILAGRRFLMNYYYLREEEFSLYLSRNCSRHAHARIRAASKSNVTTTLLWLRDTYIIPGLLMSVCQLLL